MSLGRKLLAFAARGRELSRTTVYRTSGREGVASLEGVRWQRAMRLLRGGLLVVIACSARAVPPVVREEFIRGERCGWLRWDSLLYWDTEHLLHVPGSPFAYQWPQDGGAPCFAEILRGTRLPPNELFVKHREVFELGPKDEMRPADDSPERKLSVFREGQFDLPLDYVQFHDGYAVGGAGYGIERDREGFIREVAGFTVGGLPDAPTVKITEERAKAIALQAVESALDPGERPFSVKGIELAWWPHPIARYPEHIRERYLHPRHIRELYRLTYRTRLKGRYVWEYDVDIDPVTGEASPISEGRW